MIFLGLLVYMYATKQSAIYSRQMLFVYLFLSIVFEFIGRVTLKRYIRGRIYKQPLPFHDDHCDHKGICGGMFKKL